MLNKTTLFEDLLYTFIFSNETVLCICCSWSVNSFTPCSDSGLQDPSILWFCCSLALCNQCNLHVAEGEEGVEKTEKLSERLWPGSDTHHFCLHSIWWSLVTRLHLNAKETEKYSPGQEILLPMKINVVAREYKFWWTTSCLRHLK